MERPRLLDTLLHWLLPDVCLHCREDLAPGSAPETDRLLCRACAAALAPTEPDAGRLVSAAFTYSGPAVALVHAFKFRGRRRAARLAGRLMVRELARFPKLSAYDALVPVPLHPSRLAERGYNQARLLADELSAYAGLPVAEALFRQRPTKPQWELGRGKRLRNVSEAFESRERLPKLKLLLIDDVCTTGATLEACARALRRAGAAEVRAYVFARQGIRAKNVDSRTP